MEIGGYGDGGFISPILLKVRFLTSEVHEYGHSEADGRQVGAHLCVVCSCQVLNCLEFDDDLILNEQVKPVTTDSLALIENDDFPLGHGR